LEVAQRELINKFLTSETTDDTNTLEPA